MIALTRRYRFPAAHALRLPELSDAENARLYGKCAGYHGHDYGLEVTVTGPVDERAGWILAPEQLDAIVRERVLERLGERPLNADPWFRRAVPTAENIVQRLAHELGEAVARVCGARVARVRLVETRKNRFECGEME